MTIPGWLRTCGPRCKAALEGLAGFALVAASFHAPENLMPYLFTAGSAGVGAAVTGLLPAQDRTAVTAAVVTAAEDAAHAEP